MRPLLVRLFKSELCAIKKRLEADSQRKVTLLEGEVRRLAAALEASAEQVLADLDELEREGFCFDHHPTLGLKLVATPIVIDRDEVAAALQAVEEQG